MTGTTRLTKTVSVTTDPNVLNCRREIKNKDVLKKASTTATIAVRDPLGTDPGDSGTRGRQTAKQRLSQAANELGKYRDEETWGENYSSH